MVMIRSAPEVSARQKLAELAEELEAPMQARGTALKHYLAHTIAPAARKVKELHNVMEQKVDVTFGYVTSLPYCMGEQVLILP